MVQNSRLMVSDVTTEARLPVAQILEQFGIKYTLRDSRDAWALCPFHSEKTPSWHIDLKNGRWHCYSCQQGGGFFEFVRTLVGDDLRAFEIMHHAGKGLVGSVETLSDVSAEMSPILTPANPLWAWSRFVRVNWNVGVPVAEKGYEVYHYLIHQRGFLSETLNGFDVRLTGWEEYPVAFALLEKDKIVGYVRRRITLGEKKYLYNGGFDAKDHVGYFSVDDSAPCLVVEGWLDLMKAAQWGYPRIACLFGWRLNQAKEALLIGFGVDRAVWATDNTDTGRQGWEEARKRFLKAARFGFPADRKDVGELSRHELLAGLP